MSTQGSRASTAGRDAERWIESVVRHYGYTPTRQHYVGVSVYATPLYADLLIVGVPGFPNGLIIESKWQESGGSADEKYPYLIENIFHCYPCPVIVIADGRGARRNAVNWMRAQSDGDHLYAVFNREEFVEWCRNNL